jgi:hypothetical protein
MLKLKLIVNFLAIALFMLSTRAYSACIPNITNTSNSSTNTLSGNTAGDCILNSGTITLSSDYAIGIYSDGNNSILTNNGIIDTSSYVGWGIKSVGLNSTITNNGRISTSGSGAAGLKIYGNNSIITNNGTITTSGNTADGILSVGNNIIINNSGSIRIADGNSAAITLGNAGFYGANNNTVNLLKGSIIVGDIHADTGLTGAKLNINLGSGASYAYSVTGPWTVNDLNGRPMVIGSAYAAGIGNVVTASQSLYERTSQITQSLDDRLRTYDLEKNTDQPYWINTYYSDSSRGGQGLSGSNLSFNQYRSGITAGFDVKNTFTPTEFIVNYEYGKLNIDEGNQGISSNSIMAGALFPDVVKVFSGTLSAKALVGYSDFSGDRKVLTNDVAYNGSRNVTANYQSTHLTLGSAWTKTLYQTDKIILETLVGVDLNTQHINSYSESDLFKWSGRTINQLQERVSLGMEIKPMVKPLTLFGRVGVERRDLLSGENQNFTINNTAVSYNDTNQRNTYATLNAGAYYPLTPTIKAYAQVRYYDSDKNIDSLSGNFGISGQF